MYLEFDSSLQVGHDQIDREHQVLASLINTFLDKLASRRDKDQLDRCYQDIYDYTALHFAHEEQIMRDCAYDDLALHESRHHKLLGELQERSRFILGGSVEELEGTVSFIYDWFAFHIKTSDARLAAALKLISPAPVTK